MPSGSFQLSPSDSRWTASSYRLLILRERETCSLLHGNLDTSFVLVVACSTGSGCHCVFDRSPRSSAGTATSQGGYSGMRRNAAAKPCPEGASVLSSWFSRRVAAGRSSWLSCRVLPDAKRPGERQVSAAPEAGARHERTLAGSRLQTLVRQACGRDIVAGSIP